MANKDVVACLLGAIKSLDPGDAEYRELLEEFETLLKHNKLDPNDPRVRYIVSEIHDATMVFEYHRLLQRGFTEQMKIKVDGLSPLEKLRAFRDTTIDALRIGKETGFTRPIGVPLNRISHSVRERIMADVAISVSQAEQKFAVSGLWLKDEFWQDVYRIALGGVGETQYKDAASIVAQTVRKLDNTDTLGTYNRAGIVFVGRENYMRRPYNWALMVERRDEVISDLATMLNPARHSDPEAVFDAIENARRKQIGGTAKVRSTVRSREIEFRDPASEAAFFIKWGSQTAQEIVLGTLTNGATQAALAAQYGPFWHKALSNMLEEMFTTAKMTLNGDELRAAVNEYKSAKIGLANAEGAALEFHNQTVENYVNALLHYNMARGLGSLARFIFLDAHVAAVQTATARGTRYLEEYKKHMGQVWDAVRGEVGAGLSNRKMILNMSQETRNFATELLGITQQTVGGAIMRGYMADNISATGGRSGKIAAISTRINSAVMKVGLVEGTTRGLMESVATQYHKTLSELSHLDFTELSKQAPILHSRMLEGGIDAAVWDATRGLGKVGGFLDLGAMRYVNDTAFNSITAFLRNEADFAVTIPDAYVQSLKRLHNKFGKGHPLEAGWRLAMQYQSFPLQFLRGGMARTAREYRMFGRDTVGMSPIQMAGIMVGWGAMIVQAEKLMRDGEFYSPTSPYLLMDAIDKTGMTWLFGMFASQAMHMEARQGYVDFGRIGANLLGPTAGLAFRGAGIGFNAATDILTDSGFTEMDFRRLMSFGWGLIPGNTLPIVSQFGNGVIDFVAPRSSASQKRLEKYHEAVGL